MVQDLRPTNYKEWEEYFLLNVANEDKLKQMAQKFKQFVIEDSINYNGFYTRMDDSLYVQMTKCRLIYETWLGYNAEQTTMKQLCEAIPQIQYSHLSPEDDNQYAVDFILSENNNDLCGIQVKSTNYLHSKRPIVLQTKEVNKEKNQKFTEEFKLPVLYVYYNRINNSTFVVRNCIHKVKKFLNSNQHLL